MSLFDVDIIQKAIPVGKIYKMCAYSPVCKVNEFVDMNFSKTTMKEYLKTIDIPQEIFDNIREVRKPGSTCISYLRLMVILMMSDNFGEDYLKERIRKFLKKSIRDSAKIEIEYKSKFADDNHIYIGINIHSPHSLNLGFVFSKRN